MWCRVFWCKFINVLKEAAASILRIKINRLMQSKTQVCFLWGNNYITVNDLDEL
jgi:hypothetical protein